MDFFTPYMERIAALCKAHKVRSLHAFGSAVKGDVKPQSDIDLIVDIDADDPIAYGQHYFGLLFGLEDLFARKVDLLETRAENNPFFLRAIDGHKRVLHGA